MTKQIKLRKVGVIAETLGKEGLRDIGLVIPADGKVMARQAVMLNKVEQELSSTSDIANVGDIELQEMMENAARNMEDLITQLDDPPLELPLHKLLGLDKELRSIQGSLKVEMVKKVQLQQCI